jgi:hypothetical protein
MVEAEPLEVRALYDCFDAASMAEVCRLYTEFQLLVPAPLVTRLSPEVRWLDVGATLLLTFPAQFSPQHSATAADPQREEGLLHSRRPFHGPVVTLTVYLEEYAEDPERRLSRQHQLQIAADDPTGISRMWAMVLCTGPRQSTNRRNYDVWPSGPSRDFMYRDGPLLPANDELEARGHLFIFRERLSPEGEARAVVLNPSRCVFSGILGVLGDSHKSISDENQNVWCALVERLAPLGTSTYAVYCYAVEKNRSVTLGNRDLDARYA